ncbi:MAG: MarR family winged helix-turn-helix transcriptional regulator [Opitutaceae bacterium]
MPARRVSSADYAALAEFRAALRHFLNFSAAAARAGGLSAVQHQAMLALKGFGAGTGQTVGELARHLDLRPHSAVGLVDRLAGHGIVRRTHDAEDRRRVHVTLTPKGERMLDHLSSAHRSELRRLGPALRDLLRRIG